ncbi:MAG: adenosylcobinamide-phosphate synthase CbiB [Lachnospiraceae bacterium]
MRYHIYAFAAGFFLDQLIGDPPSLWHPIRAIGALIGALEKRLFKDDKISERQKQRAGRRLTVLVLLVTFFVTAAILGFSYWLHPIFGCIVESVMTGQILACKSLKVESKKVYVQLKREDLVAARKAVSMIVGRDTEQLTVEGVTKAAVETVAENASDGVIAPLLYLALGGPVLGFLYKAVNTMDSMIGYKNDRYLFFGRTAAKLDDVVNFLPARVCALLFIAAACVLGKEFHGKAAWRIWRRDRRKHASPNSAQTEAACAGALGVQLAGDACYFGKLVKKPYIGDANRPVEMEDILRSHRLLYAAAYLTFFLCLAVLCLFF